MRRLFLGIVLLCANCASAEEANRPIEPSWTLEDSKHAVSLAFESPEAEAKGSMMVAEALRQAEELDRARDIARRTAPYITSIGGSEFSDLVQIYSVIAVGRLKMYDAEKVVLDSSTSFHQKITLMTAFGVGLAQVGDTAGARAVSAELNNEMNGHVWKDGEDHRLDFAKTIIPIAMANADPTFDSEEVRQERAKMNKDATDLWFQVPMYSVTRDRRPRTPFHSLVIQENGDAQKLKSQIAAAMQDAEESPRSVPQKYQPYKMANIIDDLVTEGHADLAEQPYQALLASSAEESTHPNWDVQSRARAHAAMGHLDAARAAAEEFGAGPDGVPDMDAATKRRLQDKYNAYDLIVASLLKRKDLADAKQIAYSLCSKSWDAVGIVNSRDNLLRDVANAQFDAGDFRGALFTASLIQTTVLRDMFMPRLISMPVRQGTN